MATISGAAWHAVTDPALKVRLLQGRNTYNWIRHRQAWQRRRQVHRLWWQWREKFDGRRGLQALMADQLGVSPATISRDFAALSLREQSPVVELTADLLPPRV